jgi:hypothetical protein
MSLLVFVSQKRKCKEFQLVFVRVKWFETYVLCKCLISTYLHVSVNVNTKFVNVNFFFMLCKIVQMYTFRKYLFIWFYTNFHLFVYILLASTWSEGAQGWS